MQGKLELGQVKVADENMVFEERPEWWPWSSPEQAQEMADYKAKRQAEEAGFEAERQAYRDRGELPPPIGRRGRAGEDFGRMAEGEGPGQDHALGMDTSYRGAHETNTYAPANDILQRGEHAGYPIDALTHPDWYDGDSEIGGILRGAQARLNAMVTIYRAGPVGTKINPGDWVTLTRSYAKEHWESNKPSSEKWNIKSMKTPAGWVFNSGDSLKEWGWYPPKSFIDRNGLGPEGKVRAKRGKDKQAVKAIEEEGPSI